MRWQIAQYTFCDKKQTLISDQGEQQLEPKLVELLSYFCQNPDTIISTDQLIDEVWQGRIVNDNTVSKSVTKLRKLFNDDARKPAFIATFPKKGYKFIAHATPYDEPPVDLGSTHLAQPSVKTGDSGPISKKQSHLKLLGFISIAAFILSVIIWQIVGSLRSPVNAIAVTTQARLFAADIGTEGQTTFSPDGTRVSFMSIREDRPYLLVKNLSDGHTVEINHGDMGVGPASWSPDGKSIVYLAATPTRCEYYIRSVKGMSFDDPQLLHTCPAGSYGKIAYTHDYDRLIYAENSGPNSPYSMYEFNLNTGEKRRLNQPELYLGGNSMFDLHPTENKLLISSPNKEQWEGFYSLDLDTNELKLLFQLDEYICCGIWSHDGEHVVLMGQHPAYELHRYDLDGQNRSTIHYSSRQLTLPSRHFNGTDYLYTSIDINSDQYIFDIEEGLIQPFAEKAVAEMLPAFSYDSRYVAYVSLESGSEEIWLYDLVNKNNRKMTTFNDGRHYIDLQWSPNNQQLLGLTLNEIHIIQADSGEFRRLNLKQKEFRGVSFKDENTIAFSVREVDRWRVYSYDLNSDTTIPEDVKWQFIQFQTESDNTIWLDQDNNLFYGEPLTAIDENAVKHDDLLIGRMWNLRKSGNKWYWFERGETSQIFVFDMEAKTSKPILSTTIPNFDISNGSVAFGTRRQTDSNLYQTIQINR